MDTFKAARLQAVRKDALSGLMQGGGEPEFRSSIAKLMAAGDVQGANALTSYYKASNPQMDLYQSAMVDNANRNLDLKRQELKAQYPWLDVGASGTEAQGATTAQEGAPRPYPKSMGELNADKKYAAGDYLTYLQGGLSETEHNLKSLEHARDLLKKDTSISGPVIGMFVKKAMAGNEDLSTIAARKLNPEAFNVAAAHQRAVVASLRPLLGARAAQQLFQSVLASTYDPSANPEDNVRRLDLIIDNIRQGAIAKQKMAEYYDTNKTLSGYVGPKFDLENFDPSEGLGDTTVANKTTPSDEPPPPEGPPVVHQTIEQMHNTLAGIPEGATGTLHLSDGTTVKAVKKNGHMYDAESGKLIPGG